MVQRKSKEKKEKPSWNDVDNPWELIAYIIDSMKNHWWKFLSILVALILLTGFSCDWKNKIFTKDPVDIRKTIGE